MTSEPQRYYRQYVKFSFFRVTPQWRTLSADAREAAKQDFQSVAGSFGDRLIIRSYTLMGTRGDADFLLWQIGDRLDDIQRLATALFSTAMAPYLETPYSYLAMTRRSTYEVKDEAHDPDARLIIRPSKSRYFFVYPFVKTRAWYRLSQEERQGLMNEHIRIGRKYPSVKLNTTYSFGLDDQEFVVAFETDEPADFLDLVMELRETEGSLYTLRDTPIFSCIAMPLGETLDSLGMPGPARATQAPAGWTRVALLADLPSGGQSTVYFGGEQIALFNREGRVFAFGNRCPHANAPLTEGCVEGTTLTCAAHNSQFDIESGAPLRGPASRPLTTYAVKLEDGDILLAPLP
ncbi:MAG TPA: chlorite dismutase family protein [Dehalococcoidia bacterium]|nr:chlorite dismutase family protein [Dehalococcoidia bacterium]